MVLEEVEVPTSLPNGPGSSGPQPGRLDSDREGQGWPARERPRRISMYASAIARVEEAGVPARAEAASRCSCCCSRRRRPGRHHPRRRCGWRLTASAAPGSRSGSGESKARSTRRPRPPPRRRDPRPSRRCRSRRRAPGDLLDRAPAPPEAEQAERGKEAVEQQESPARSRRDWSLSGCGTPRKPSTPSAGRQPRAQDGRRPRPQEGQLRLRSRAVASARSRYLPSSRNSSASPRSTSPSSRPGTRASPPGRGR